MYLLIVKNNGYEVREWVHASQTNGWLNNASLLVPVLLSLIKSWKHEWEDKAYIIRD